jgi:2'-5' RNA ligase
LRAFVALDISDAKILDSLVSFQSELAATRADLKLVERENLHFTLRFLGEIPEDVVREADSRLGQLHLSGGSVSVAGVGAFPNPRRPRVIWVGVPSQDETKVLPIARAVAGALEGIGESDSRPFQAHLTLARVRSFRNIDPLANLLRENSSRSFGTYELGSVRLKSSQLTPSGPIYRDVGVYNLG